MKRYNWATLGCGVIANELALAMKKRGMNLYSVANRTRSKADAFAEKYGISKVYDRIEDVFLDKDVDIIYISTPHNTHIGFIMEALNHGKHVLSEKAITLNQAELAMAAESAKRKNLALAEAMTVYHMPLNRRIKSMADAGKFGPLRMIQTNFGSYKEYDMSNRFFNRDLAGGALLDIGIYALSFTRFFMSEKPDRVTSQVRYAETGVDESEGILMTNPAGEMATATISLHAKQAKRGTLIYDKAYIEIYDYPRAEEAVITWTEDGHKETVREGRTSNALLYEILNMEQAVSGAAKAMCLDYTTDVMEIMTGIRSEWGMKYPEEE